MIALCRYQPFDRIAVGVKLLPATSNRPLRDWRERKFSKRDKHLIAARLPNGQRRAGPILETHAPRTLKPRRN